MARNENTRVASPILDADQNAYLALKTISGYQPVNAAYAINALTTKYDALRAAQEAELNAQNALSAARDAVVASSWDFHNAMLGVKDQVIAQYGPNSDQVASLGLKKKSERKAPVRKSKSAA